MIKNSILYVAFFLLVGCATSPNNVTNSPPMMQQSQMTMPHVPTKMELLQEQSQAAQQGLMQYEKTHQTKIIETDEVMTLPFGKPFSPINCTILRTCDIKLEIGEKITGVYPGDTSRWLFEEAVSGEGDNQQAHVIFKPKLDDVATNAIITTTRRTYHLELHSQKNSVVKQIEFYYPDDFENKWKLLKKEAALARESEENHMAIELGRWSSHELDFNYRIETSLFSDKPAWIPLRVFNDGTHVYLQMPDRASTTSLPALFIVGKDGQPTLVNYRVQKPYYIVDQLFQQAVLATGVGQYQQRITITYHS